MSRSAQSRWPHVMACLVSVCTLFLIFVGGLVTSTQSGLAVPDWPLSYGRLMPPMIGGILFEHGHRLVAATVGFLTVLAAIVIALKEPRAWVRKAAWAAVGLVVLQGVFGGITVLLRLPPIVSIVHACLAQTFFCTVTAIAVWTSGFWRSEPPLREEAVQLLPLHQIALGLTITLFLQLIVGAILRHTGWGFPLHLTGAVMATCFTVIAYRRVRTEHANFRALRRVSAALIATLLVQLLLGGATYFLVSYDFKVIPVPFFATLIITAHVAAGAFLLGLSVVFGLVSYRSRPLETPKLSARLSDYLELTKPGISFMAGITALAGFILGSRGEIHLIRLLYTSVGTLFVAGAAGTFNMLIERDIDSRMNRTRKRPLPSGRMNPGEALFLGCLLSTLGLLYLAWAVNLLTAFLAGLTLSIYLYVYTPLKKVTALCTLAGAVAGALPPVMGWTAANGHFGLEAWALFGILFFWQFPHFFSLAWLYRDDYALAGLRMLPMIDVNENTTAYSIVWNSLALLAVSALPTLMGLTGRVYLGTALLLGLGMTALSTAFLFQRTRLNAKRIFLVSVFYMPVLVAAMVLNRVSALG